MATTMIIVPRTMMTIAYLGNASAYTNNTELVYEVWSEHGICILYITLIESCQTQNTQMSILSNVLNKRTMINTTRNTMTAELYAPKKS